MDRGSWNVWFIITHRGTLEVQSNYPWININDSLVFHLSVSACNHSFLRHALTISISYYSIHTIQGHKDICVAMDGISRD